MATFNEKDFPLQDETGLLIGVGMEIHRLLGRGFLEIVYKDAFEYEMRQRQVAYEREKEYTVQYKTIILPHKFYADFVVFNQIILELKSKEGIANEDMAQAMNYLAVSKCKVALILNFGTGSLQIKRVILSK
jgi:GxxExxY protein